MLKKKEQKRQPYKKPNIKVIELVADEVLAVGCKSSVGTSGKNDWLPAACIVGLSPCVLDGS